MDTMQVPVAGVEDFADGAALPGMRMFPHAFSPVSIGSLTLKNRMIVSAMVTNFCEPNGMATEKYIAYHEHKAQGGWGLIITEDYVINPHAGGFVHLPGLYDDAQIESHRALTERVHAVGGRIAAQLYHAGRETTSAVTGEQPVAPSAVREPSMPETPRALSLDEIHELVEQFGDAAYRAKRAGFDAVEVHGAHGYLVGAFASPFSNKRADEYGGSTRNRARFACEIIRNIKAKCGEDYPVIYRMSAVEYVPGGLELGEACVLARLVEQAGADCINVSQGVYASTDRIIPPAAVSPAAYVDNAAGIKTAVSVPVIAVGRIVDIDVAESVLASGKADLVAMARASLADPDMPRKAAEGRLEDIHRCIACVQGCSGENGKGNCVRCLVNPLTGMEDEYRVEPAGVSRRVLVVGGGIAGCEAAIVSAERGHDVTLVEESDHLGGQWVLASVPVGKSDFTSLVIWQRHALEKLGVRVMLGTKANRALVDSLAPEVVVAATGSEPLMPRFIPGTDRDFVVTAHDVLEGKVEVGGRIVVVGGGLVGAETADMLGESCDVTIVEMLPQIMRDGEASPAMLLERRLAEHGVKVLTSTKVLRIDEHEVACEGPEGGIDLRDVDYVVMAIGVKARRDLLDELESCPYEVACVGDAAGVKNGYLGIREGFEAGLAI